MADYYTTLCFKVSCIDSAAARNAEALFVLCQQLLDGDIKPADKWQYDFVSLDFGSFGISIDSETSDSSVLIVSSSESANVDALTWLLGEFIAKSWLIPPVAYEWANTCNRPRPEAFGGGACIVTGRDQARWLNTSDWLRRELSPVSGDIVKTVGYLKNHGAKCPHCGSKNTEALDDHGADGDHYTQSITCLHCHEDWRDVYQLVDYVEGR